MIGVKDEKIKLIFKVCIITIAYLIIGLCGLFFILVSKVDALTLTPTQMECSWNTDASTIRTENCLTGADYNIGGYTNYVNFLPTFNSSYGSQLWTISFTLDMYVVDYGNEGDYIVTPIFQMYKNNQIQSLQNLSRQIVSQRADCSNSAGCMLIRTFNFTYQWQGDINGITIQNLSSYYNRADCGWLQDNPATCQASYPRIHYLEMTAYYNDGQGDQMISDSINNQTDIIVGNSNANADRIIDSNTTSAQSVINADNYNTDRTIDAIEKQNLRCENYNFNKTNIPEPKTKGYLTNTGDIVNHINWWTSNYIPINENKNYTLTNTISTNIVNYCLYNENKEIISCENYTNKSHSITNTKGYIRISFPIDNWNQNATFTGEYCYNIQDKQAEEQKKQNDYLMDDTPADYNIISGIQATPDTPISSLLTMPIRLVQAFLDNINGQCADYTFGSLYGTTLQLKCSDIRNIPRYLGSAYEVIDYFMCFFMIYNIFMLLIHAYETITTLKDDFANIYETKVYGNGKGFDY